MARFGLLCVLALLVLVNVLIVEADPLPQFGSGFGRRGFGGYGGYGRRGGLSISASKSISISRGGGGYSGAGSYASSGGFGK